MDVDGELHLHRVGFFVGERAHAHDRFALVDNGDSPIDTLFAAGFDLDAFGQPRQPKRARVRFSEILSVG